MRQDVIGYKGADEPFCYGGKASLESIADSWKASRIGSSESEKFNVEDFQQWVREMPISEMVSWAVGGLVLTAGILFIRLVFSCIIRLFSMLYERFIALLSIIPRKMPSSFRDCSIICIMLSSAR